MNLPQSGSGGFIDHNIGSSFASNYIQVSGTKDLDPLLFTFPRKRREPRIRTRKFLLRSFNEKTDEQLFVPQASRNQSTALVFPNSLERHSLLRDFL